MTKYGPAGHRDEEESFITDQRKIHRTDQAEDGKVHYVCFQLLGLATLFQYGLAMDVKVIDVIVSFRLISLVHSRTMQ